MSDTHPPLHLAIALDGAGWHPAAWREPTARPGELFTPGYWTDLIGEAEAGLLDFVTIEDSLAPQSAHPDRLDDRTDQVRGRLDAALIASRVAPLTSRIGLVPTVTVTHTEPFHISKAIATLDHVSEGRAGWRAQVARRVEAPHFGRRDLAAWPSPGASPTESPSAAGELFAEAGDVIEVVRRLWDSWEDDAEIRDVATGRFIDRDKLHYIDFEGRFFSVRGPSIVPRPPQGQPVVAVLAHAAAPFRLGAEHADVVFVTPRAEEDASRVIAEIREAQQAAGRAGETVHVFADLTVFLGPSTADAKARKARLDDLDGAEYRSDAHIFTGTAADLAQLLLRWRAAGLTGFRLRPAVLPDDLHAVTRELVPELQRRGAFRAAYEADTLRGLLGLPRPANRYATAAA